MNDSNSNPMAIASIVLGMLALLANMSWLGSCCCSFLGCGGGAIVLVLAIAAIGAGFMGRNAAVAANESPALATIGLALGGVALALDLVGFVFTFGLFVLGMVMSVANS